MSSPPSTLAHALSGSKVGMVALKQSYGPMLGLVEQLLGVIPNADPILAIWPTGFRNYNLLVPALFNLPTSLFAFPGSSGSRLKTLIGLSGYASSRAAECMYCSAHMCAFSLRRGARAEALSGVPVGGVEEAAMKVGEAIGKVPASFSREHLDGLGKYLGRDELRWVGYSAAIMGFLNKAMDVLGVELERECASVAEGTLRGTGWGVGKHGIRDLGLEASSTVATGEEKVKVETPVDGLGTYFRILRLAPGAVRLEKEWIGDAPGDNAAAKVWLEKNVGFSFEVLDHIGPARVVKAVTAVLRDNLDPDSASGVGRNAKGLSALVFARCVGNERLEKDARRLIEAVSPGMGEGVIEKVLEFATTPGVNKREEEEEHELLEGLGNKTRTVLALARVASMSPAVIDEEMVMRVTKELDPAEVVEVVIWLAVMQMLHRLDVFHVVWDVKKDE